MPKKKGGELHSHVAEFAFFVSAMSIKEPSQCTVRHILCVWIPENFGLRHAPSCESTISARVKKEFREMKLLETRQLESGSGFQIVPNREAVIPHLRFLKKVIKTWHDPMDRLDQVDIEAL